MIVKCPYCGSTAQVKEKCSTHIDDKTITVTYECGCGTIFVNEYEIKRTMTENNNKHIAATMLKTLIEKREQMEGM